MPGQGGLPPSRTKTPAHQPHHVSPAAPESQGTEPDPAYRREQKGRRIVAEGAFASLDRLGWAKSRLRGLWRVDCEGYMAALAHNVLKAVRRLRQSTGPPVPLKPSAQADGFQATPNAYGDPTTIGEPPRSKSSGSLMTSFAALMSVAAFVAPCPSVGTHFFNKPVKVGRVGGRLLSIDCRSSA